MILCFGGASMRFVNLWVGLGGGTPTAGMTTTCPDASRASAASFRTSPGAHNRTARVRAECGGLPSPATARPRNPRRLRTRWETRDDTHDAFLQLAHRVTRARKDPAFRKGPFQGATVN